MQIELTEKQAKLFTEKLNKISQMEIQLQIEKESLLKMAELLTEEEIPKEIKVFNLLGNTLTLE